MPRGRPARIDRPWKVGITLPESIKARLHLALYSDLEQRVPHGAISGLIAELLERELERRGF